MPAKATFSLRKLLLLHEVAFLLLVLVTGLLSGVSAYFWQQTAAESIRLNNSIYLSEQIRGELFIQIQEVIKARLLEDIQALGVYAEFSRSIDRHFNQLRQTAISREEAEVVQSLQLSYRKIQKDMNKIFGDPYAANYVIRMKILDPGFSKTMVREFETSYLDFKEYFSAQHAKVEKKILFWTRYAPVLIPVIFLLGVIIVVYTSRVIRKSFVNPVGTITVGASVISKGNLEHRIPQKGVHEIQDIADSINRMAADLQTSRDALVQQERQAALGALVPVVAHNIRNPLASIRATAQVMQDAENQHEIKEGTTAIIDTIDRLGRWVNALVSYLHPLKPVMQDIRIVDLFESAASLLVTKINSKEITIKKANWDCEVKVKVDPDLMEQAIYGLLVNAVDASPEKGEITITMNESENMLQVSIRDQGPGLPFAPKPDNLEPGPSTKQLGTGLGIPIAFKICQSHGWELEFHNQVPRGTEILMIIKDANRGTGNERKQ